MTLQWTVVAIFLYVEIAFLGLLMLPWIRPPLWKRIIHSRLVKTLEMYSNIYYYAFGGILLLLFFDAVREVRKYDISDITIDTHQSAQADTVIHMRLFRAQRNLYIAGFALFLYLVIRRMVQLIVVQANLMASNEASIKQAQGAHKAAQSMLETKNEKDQPKKGNLDEDEAYKKLKARITDLQSELKSVSKDRDAMKEQAEGVKREFDRVIAELDTYKRKGGTEKKTD